MTGPTANRRLRKCATGKGAGKGDDDVNRVEERRGVNMYLVDTNDR